MDRLGPRSCVLCGASDPRRGVTTIATGRNGLEVEIRGVPAVLCHACSDAAVDGPLAVELSDAIERIICLIEHHRAKANEPAPAG